MFRSPAIQSETITMAMRTLASSRKPLLDLPTKNRYTMTPQYDAPNQRYPHCSMHTHMHGHMHECGYSHVCLYMYMPMHVCATSTHACIRFYILKSWQTQAASRIMIATVASTVQQRKLTTIDRRVKTTEYSHNVLTSSAPESSPLWGAERALTRPKELRPRGHRPTALRQIQLLSCGKPLVWSGTRWYSLA